MLTAEELYDQLANNGLENAPLVYPNYIYNGYYFNHLAHVIGWEMTDNEEVRLIINIKEGLS